MQCTAKMVIRRRVRWNIERGGAAVLATLGLFTLRKPVQTSKFKFRSGQHTRMVHSDQRRGPRGFLPLFTKNLAKKPFQLFRHRLSSISEFLSGALLNVGPEGHSYSRSSPLPRYLGGLGTVADAADLFTLSFLLLTVTTVSLQPSGPQAFQCAILNFKTEFRFESGHSPCRALRRRLHCSIHGTQLQQATCMYDDAAMLRPHK